MNAEAVARTGLIARWTRLMLHLRWLVLGIWLAVLIAGGLASIRLDGLVGRYNWWLPSNAARLLGTTASPLPHPPAPRYAHPARSERDRAA